MRSRTERAVWTAVAAAAVAGGAAAWWTSAQWLPHAKPWAEQAWRSATRPSADTLPQASQAASSRKASSASGAEPAPVLPRKCLQDGRTLYTSEPCPAGSHEMAVDGGSLTQLPR